MKDCPYVGIIVPIYNVEPFLRKCLDSVINQTYKNLQIVLIDDGSTDNSFFIAKEYFEKDNRITLIKKTNKGLSHTRNVGLDYLSNFIQKNNNGGGGYRY